MTQIYGTAQLGEARTLCTQMIDGALSWRRVRLAAYLGNPAARLSFGQDPLRLGARRSPLDARRDLRQWFAGIRGWGKEAWVRGAIAAASAALPEFERRYNDSSPREALDAAIAWVACPCPLHARRSAQAVQEALHNRRDFAGCASLRAAQAAASEGGESLLHAARAVDDVAWVLDHPRTVRQVIRRALVPWALGYVTGHAA